MTHIKIKVMPSKGGQQEWDTVIKHARKLGALSRDDEYDYRNDLPCMIVDNYYIKYSSPKMKTKAGFTEPLKISVSDFLSLETLHDVANIGKPVDKAAVANAVAAVRKASPCMQDTLTVSSVNVLVQNPILWSSQGLPRLKALGVEITMLGDVSYVIDVVSNTATEFTAESASAIAKANILDGKVSPYTIWANEFQLIENLVQTKVIPDQE